MVAVAASKEIVVNLFLDMMEDIATFWMKFKRIDLRDHQSIHIMITMTLKILVIKSG